MKPKLVKRIESITSFLKGNDVSFDWDEYRQKLEIGFEKISACNCCEETKQHWVPTKTLFFFFEGSGGHFSGLKIRDDITDEELKVVVTRLLG